jgi:SAM-dependent methyltransferase
MIRKVYIAMKTLGVGGLVRAVYKRVAPDRMKFFPQARPLVESRIGLEFGGPSPIFTPRGCIPVYPLAARIDNCNFGADTMWEGKIDEGETFRFDPAKPAGRQYVAEASSLPFIEDGRYDFVLSSHCLEHLANPLKALREWVRILKDNGTLFLVVPHKDGTFDRKRPVTALSHMIEDFEADTTEKDLTHLEEILALHDLAMDPEAGSPEAFAERSRRNFENRGLHHHVFDARLTVEVVNHIGMQILAVEMFRPYHIIVIARKVPTGKPVNNDTFRGNLPSWTSPFPSDRSLH